MSTSSAYVASTAPLAARRGPAAPLVKHGRALRIPLASSVNLCSRDNFFAGSAYDISAGGLFLETTARIAIGEVVVVRLQVLERVFAISTEVSWTLWDRAARPLALGVRFVSLPAALVWTIASFMRLRSPIHFEVEDPC
jgi:Tfp pilus assembly protein PilZ